YDVFMKASRLGRIRSKGNETIAIIDIDEFGNRSNPVRRVEVAVSMDRMIGPPPRFRKSFLSKFRAAIVSLYAIIKFYAPKIVLVAGLEVDQFSKHILSHHI